MAEFSYQAKDARGKPRSGTIRAQNKALAKKQLARRRLRSIKIKVAGQEDFDDITYLLGKFIYKDDKGIQIAPGGERQADTKTIIVFTKQFSTMLSSGVPLVQSLSILAGQQAIRSFGRNLNQIRIDVENGLTLSDAMAKFPKQFDNLYISMIKAGETSGSLDVIMMKLVEYIEKAAKIKSQVKGAMVYPALVIFVAIAVVTGLLIFVVPQFTEQYIASGKELPAMTQFIVDLSASLQMNWLEIVGAIFAIFFGISYYRKTAKGREVTDNLLLRVPLTGDLLRKIAVGRFCQTMSTMLTSGVNLLEALTICAASSGLVPVEKFILNAREAVERGQGLSAPLMEGDLFPKMVTSMISVGEATGKMDEMLTKISEFYEEEVDLAVATMLSMIEPIMIVVIGSIVGFIVIAMYLPIFDMAGQT